MTAVFLIAVVVRGIVLMTVIGHQEVILQPDSKIYVSLAQGLREYGTLCYPESPLNPDAERMPGYPFFLACILSVAGGSLLTVVVVQILLDSVSCVMTCHLADLFCNRAGFLGGILAALNLGMITYSHFILNDSLFLFVFLVLLTLIVQFLRKPLWQTGAALGVGFAIATFIRPVVLYFPLFLIPFFFVRFVAGSDISPWVAARKALLFGMVFFFTLSPWLMRNYIQFGRFKLTAQSGEHLLLYIVPFTWQYSRGIPFIEGMRKASEAFDERMLREGLNLEKMNPFDVSDLRMRMAVECLSSEPKAAIAKAWVYGMAKNLFAPAIIDFSYLLNIERPHFFYTKGTTTIERTWNFLTGMRGLFSFAVIGSLMLIAISRLIQLWGMLTIIRYKVWDGVLLFLIISYFLLVSGPVGYAKYRLPFEPILIILLTIGIKDIYVRWMNNKAEA